MKTIYQTFLISTIFIVISTELLAQSDTSSPKTNLHLDLHLGQSFIMKNNTAPNAPGVTDNTFSYSAGLSISRRLTLNKFGEGLSLKLGAQYGKQGGWAIAEYEDDGVHYSIVDYEELTVLSIPLSLVYRFNARNLKLEAAGTFGYKYILKNAHAYYKGLYKKLLPYLGFELNYVIPKIKYIDSIGAAYYWTIHRKGGSGYNSLHYGYTFLTIKASMNK